MGSFTQQGGSVTASGGNINGNYSSTGLYVYGGTVTAQDGTLTATGGDTSGSSYGISMSSSSSVTVGSAAVTATGGTGNYSYGLYVDSSSPSVSPSVTLSGSGSLTARSGLGTKRAVGIYLVNILGSTGSVTVGNGSTLLTNSVLAKSSPLAPTGDGSWLIYGQSNQTSAVGGNYTLEENLTIESGNTLTIPAGSTLTVPQGKTLTVDGTLNIANQSSLAGDGTLAGNGTFNLTNPDPVISGSDTLTYDGNDHFTDFSLTAPSGTVEVMGQNFAISSSPSLDGWTLETQVIKSAGTYTLTASHTGGRTIQKQVTVSKATSNIAFNNYALGKTYDGTALTNPTESQLTLTGAGYNDVTFTWYKDSVDEANKLNSAPTDAGTYYLVASIPESNNTSGSEATSGAITISPAIIYFTSAKVADKTYDGTTDATVTGVEFTGLVNDESLTSGTDYTVTAAFTDKSAGENKTATVTVTLTNGNYTFANREKTATANATAKISPLAVALTWSETTSFTYDGQPHSVTASITNAVSGDDVGLDYGTSTTTATAAKEYSATVSGLSGSDASNYTLAGVSNTTQAWSITTADSKLGLTVDNNAPTYGETITFTVTPAIQPANGIGLLAADTVTFAVGDTELGRVPVTEGAEATFPYETSQKGLAIGENKVTATYTGSGNLNPITETITITLQAKSVQATVDGPVTKVYDGTTDAKVSLKLDGVLDGDDVDVTYGKAAYNSPDVADANKVEVTGIALIGEDAGFYSVNAETKADAAITAKPITVTAEDKTKTYGDADPELTYTVEGLVQGDSLTGALTRDEGENVGEYAITLGTLGNPNYKINFVGATLTITPRSLLGAVVTANPAHFTYNGKEQTPEVSVTLGEKTLQPQVDYTVTFGKDTVNAGEVQVTVNGTGNYSGTAGTTYTIDPAAFQYGVANQNVKINTGLDTVNVSETATGVNGETVQGTLTWYADEARTQALDKSYRFGGEEGQELTLYWTFTPAKDQTNYVTQGLNGSTVFTLTDKPAPKLTAKDLTRAYNGKAVALNELTSQATTDISGSWSFAEGTPELKNAGVYQVTLVYTPKEPQYYTVGTIQVTVTIEKLDATAKVDLSTDRVTKGDALPDVDVVFTGVLDGETLKPQALTFAGMPVDSNTAGQYVVSVGETTRETIEAQDAAKNYNLTYETATLSIVDVTVLPTPAELQGDFRLELGALTSVHPNLQGTYSTVADIQKELVRVAAEKLSGVGTGDTVFYDLILMQSKDNGKTWQPADADAIPESGITVTLPYAFGGNGNGYDYVVNHMATVAGNNLQPGQVETLTLHKTADGLQVNLKSLSPVSISRKETPKQESGSSSHSEETPAAAQTPAATPAPGESIAYYTCPACGYHDWTATQEGYRCDHCGYVESLKQLSGYGNVKGVYEPKSTGNTPAAGNTAIVPQTGDNSNPVLWVCLLGASAVLLAAIVIYQAKRRKNQK